MVGVSQTVEADIPSPAGGDLNALLDTFVLEDMAAQPEIATSLGLDTGPRAGLKAKLTDRSPDGFAARHALEADQLKRLEGVDIAGLNAADALNRDVVLFSLGLKVDAAKAFKYAGGVAGSPYALNQFQSSAYQIIPDFLDSQHRIATIEDAEAYLSRLEGFAVALDQDSALARFDLGLNVVPPDFITDRTLAQVKALRGAPADKSVLVQSLARRAAAKGLSGDWAGRASAVYQEKVQPALDRQIGLLESLRANAPRDAGVWRLPDGDAYYAASVRAWTSTTLTADEIHQRGLDLVRDLTAKIDTTMRSQGFTRGSVGQRLRAMFTNGSYQYANTDAGKAHLLADVGARVAAMRAKLPSLFGVQPKADVEVRRVPVYLEAGAPGGYYETGSLDGSRPGAFYINLRDTAELPNWTLPTLAYHEAIPGHHLQLTLAQETQLPLIRKLLVFSAYVEGWALYAEQLALEMGFYDDDPLGRIGYLHDALLRAARLVLDSGLHGRRWSRERAIAYYVDTLGDPEAVATTEVERYCVAPGQACGYMLGKMAWLRERDRAKAALGDRFDLRKFHDVGLASGALPLALLPRVIDRYIAGAKG